MRILLVEDDRRLGRVLQKGLLEEGYGVDLATTGGEAQLLAETRHYDLIILDRMLPEISGDDLLARWRRAGMNRPILMLTALDAVADRVTGLRAGADDYLVKPFAFAELLARVESLLRRSSGSPGVLPRVGELQLDPKTGLLTCGERQVLLSAREMEIMLYLMRHPGQILSRAMIADACWQEPEEITENAVEAQVKNLRKRIAQVSDRPWIQTRRGLGYVLEGASK